MITRRVIITLCDNFNSLSLLVLRHCDLVTRSICEMPLGQRWYTSAWSNCSVIILYHKSNYYSMHCTAVNRNTHHHLYLTLCKEHTLTQCSVAVPSTVVDINNNLLSAAMERVLFPSPVRDLFFHGVLEDSRNFYSDFDILRVCARVYYYYYYYSNIEQSVC